MLLIAAAMVGAMVTLAGCSNCDGNVTFRTTNKQDGYALRIHKSAGSGEDSFCTVNGTKDRLAACDVGAQYPKCSK